MADQSPSSVLTPAAERFGAGLTEAKVRHLQVILREQTGIEVSLPEAWSRAIELLSLVETLCVVDTPSQVRSSNVAVGPLSLHDAIPVSRAAVDE